MPPESRTNTSPRPGRLITRPGGRQGGTGASAAVRRAGRASGPNRTGPARRPTRCTFLLITGCVASPATAGAVAAATVAISVRVLSIISLTYFSGLGSHH